MGIGCAKQRARSCIRFGLTAFALPNRDRTIRGFKADLAAAGIDYRDDAGRVVDFHALRHTCGSFLAATGTHPKVAQSLMRHSDINLTMSRYSHVLIGQESDAVAGLPDLAAPPREALAVAVGQDGAAETGPACLARCLALSGGKERPSANLDERESGATPRDVNPCKSTRKAVESGRETPSAGVAELADARDSKSRQDNPWWGFDSPLRHHLSLARCSSYIPRCGIARFGRFGGCYQIVTTFRAADSAGEVIPDAPRSPLLVLADIFFRGHRA